MNKFERQDSADQTTLPDDFARELSHITTEVIEISDAPTLAPRAPLTPDEVRTILMSLLLTMFLAALDQTIVATALPTIGRQFNDVSNLSWVITAYLLASTAVAPVFGTLSDIYGRRVMITVSLALFTVGSILCAVAPNMTVLISGAQPAGARGRRHHACGADGDLRRGLTARARPVPGLFLRRVDGGRIAGLVLGGVFAEHLHWSMIFWINVPLALGALALLLPKDGKIRIRSQAQARLARRRAADGLRRRGHAGADLGRTRYLWLSPVILSMIGAAVALAFAFVWHANKADEPFLPLSLMRGPIAPYAMTAGGCALGAITGLTVQLPLYYEVVYHLSASEAGLALIPIAAVSTCGAAIAGKTMARAKHYKRVAVVGTSLAVLLSCSADGDDAAAVGISDCAGAVRARPRHDFPRQRGLAAEFGGARQYRHRDRRDEFLPLADVVVHGRGLYRDPADGAGRGYCSPANIAARRIRFPSPT